MKNLVKKFMPDNYFVDEAQISESMAKDFVVTAFAIARGRTTCSAEAGHLPVLRFGAKGQRQVICTPTMSLLDHMSTKTRCSPKEANHWFKSLT